MVVPAWVIHGGHCDFFTLVRRPLSATFEGVRSPTDDAITQEVDILKEPPMCRMLGEPSQRPADAKACLVFRHESLKPVPVVESPHLRF